MLPAAPARLCLESDPGDSSLQTAASCPPQTSASDVQPDEKCNHGHVTTAKQAVQNRDASWCGGVVTKTLIQDGEHSM